MADTEAAVGDEDSLQQVASVEVENFHGSDDAVGETLSGWLQKKEKYFSGAERWRRCWFVLSASADGQWTLSHYEHGTNMREFVGAERLAQGDRKVAYVSNIKKILFVGNKGIKFEIVFNDNSPSLMLRAATEDVCKRWVFAILRLRDGDQKLAAPKTKRSSLLGTGAFGTRIDGTMDKRRERESIKMTTDFLHDSELFMSKAKKLREQIERREGTTIKRGNTRNRTRKRDQAMHDTSHFSADEEDGEDEDDFIDSSYVPPPPGLNVSLDRSHSKAGDEGVQPVEMHETSHAESENSHNDDDDQASFHDEVQRQRDAGVVSSSGGFLCFWSKPKQRHTARLPEGADAGKTDDGSSDANQRKRSLRRSISKVVTTKDDKSKDFAYTKDDRNNILGPGLTSSQLGSGPADQGTQRRFNTVAGDETLPRKLFSGINTPRGAKSGQATPEVNVPGPRMAVRPLMRGNGFTTGRIEVKTPATEQLIKETIETSISLSGMLFDDLDAHSMHEMVSRMYRVSVKAKDDVVKQGETGDSFYVIEKGSYHVYRRNADSNGLPELVAEKGPRTFFGELALLYEQPAAVTVRAVTDGVLWAIDRQTFFEIRKAQARKRQARKMQCLNSMEVLSENLTEEELVTLADAMTEKVYKRGDIIVERGDTLDQVLIVGSGRVDMLIDNELKSILRRGESFGEWALLEKATKSDVRLVASEDRTTTLTLDVDEFEALIGPLGEAIKARWADSVQTLFPDMKTPSKSLKVKSSAASAEEYVGHTLQTIKEKHAKRQESMEETTVDSGYDLNIGQKKSSGKVRLPSSTSVRSEDLDSEDTEEENEDVELSSSSAGDLAWENLPLPCTNIGLNNLEPLAKLGKGSFGRVHLVRPHGKSGSNIEMTDPVTGERTYLPPFMALKTLRRCFITDNGWEEMVENERHAMAEIAEHGRSRFVVALYAAFYDRKNIYFLMELCQGGDMYGAMRRVNRSEPRLSETDAKFYIVSVYLGLKAIHACQIVYRDAKPENFFLTSEGYLKIADFGLAKKTNMTYTVCGTPEYMAPEIILGRGHDSAVDWWALGVFAFELIAGNSPFQGRSPMDCYEAVLGHQDASDIKFPEYATFSKDCRKFICGLLEPRKPKRVKLIRSGLENHPFLSKFPIAQLQKGELSAPFTPKVRDFHRFESPSFKNKYDPKFKDADVDRSGWQPKI